MASLLAQLMKNPPAMQHIKLGCILKMKQVNWRKTKRCNQGPIARRLQSLVSDTSGQSLYVCLFLQPQASCKHFVLGLSTRNQAHDDYMLSKTRYIYFFIQIDFVLTFHITMILLCLLQETLNFVVVQLLSCVRPFGTPPYSTLGFSVLRYLP